MYTWGYLKGRVYTWGYLKGRVYTWGYLKGRVYTWGFLKGCVYHHKPRNLNEMKDAIWQEVLTIEQQLLARAMDDLKRRIENCIQEDGRHLNKIIFHT